MQSKVQAQGRAAAFLSAAIGLQALVCLVWMLHERQQVSTPSSLTFWVAAACLGLLAIGLLFLAVSAAGSSAASKLFQRNLNWLKDHFYPWVFAALLAAFLLFTSFLILSFGENEVLLNRLAPILSAFFFLVILDFLAIYILSIRKVQLPAGDKALRLILLAFTGLWVLILLSRIGLDPDTHFWNVAGVPVLLNQAAAILLAALLGEQALTRLNTALKSKPTLRKGLLLLTCLLIWAASALLWLQAPIAQSVFVEGPWLPNGDYVPHSDAAIIDVGAQYMAIGEGLDKNLFTDKPLYTFFLGILHLAAGQSYLRITSLQILVLALLPVLLYLLGRKLGGEFLGLAAAAFGTVKEFNGIFGMWQISVSNSRLYMSELPLTLLLVALGLALFNWFNHARKPGSAPLVSGAILGFATLIRTNPLLLLLLVPLFTLLAYKFAWKALRKPLLLFLLGFIISTAPWLAYTQWRYGESPILYKIDSVIRTRLTHQPQRLPPAGVEIQAPLLFTNRKESLVPDLPPQAPEPEAEPTSPAPQTGTPAPLAVPTQTVNLPLVQAGEADLLDAVTQAPVPPTVLAGHFLNNQIKALFVLPFQAYPLELEPVLKLPYWEEPVTWQGELPFSHALAFAANILLIALGLGFAWRRFAWAGLVPLLINLGYFGANAIGRTSGSRYLLPADWTIWLYWLAGIASLLAAFQPQLLQTPVTRQSQNIGRIWLNALVLLVLAAAIPLFNLAIPRQYTQEDQAASFARLPLDLIYDDIELTPARVVHLYEKPGSRVVYGKMINLRFGDNWMTQSRGYMFEVLSPDFTEVFLLTYEAPERPIPSGVDVVAIGCQREGFLEAYLAYIPSENLLLHLGFPWEDSLCDTP